MSGESFYLVQGEERTEIPPEVAAGIFEIGERIGDGKDRDVLGLKAALGYVYNYAVIRGALGGKSHEGV